MCDRKKPTEQERRDLLFSLIVIRHTSSNAVVIAKRLQTLGIGAGQPSHVGAVSLAVNQAGQNVRGSVMAADASFLVKAVEMLQRKGLAIVQPGGSGSDEEVIAICEKFNIAM